MSLNVPLNIRFLVELDQTARQACSAWLSLRIWEMPDSWLSLSAYLCVMAAINYSVLDLATVIEGHSIADSFNYSIANAQQAEALGYTRY